MDKTLILGECKWDRDPKDVGILEKLIAKTEKVLPNDGQWKTFYLGFARSGWTSEAVEFAEGSAKKAQGKQWRSTGMLLKSLDQIDEELAKWTI